MMGEESLYLQPAKAAQMFPDAGETVETVPNVLRDRSPPS